jgi:hypothetical protein
MYFSYCLRPISKSNQNFLKKENVKKFFDKNKFFIPAVDTARR